MSSRPERRPPRDTHPSQEGSARSIFTDTFLRLRRGNPTDADKQEAARAFETWWNTGEAGGKYIGPEVNAS